VNTFPTFLAGVIVPYPYFDFFGKLKSSPSSYSTLHECVGGYVTILRYSSAVTKSILNPPHTTKTTTGRFPSFRSTILSNNAG
jgi:hypothetical protein